jgi:hypothetical protein
LELFCGDLTDMPPEHAVDVLVVSAFPNSYSVKNRRTLVSALHRRGITVHELAKDKAADLRESFSCWMSHPIEASYPGIQFKRILCFEPKQRGDPPQVVGDIFQSLMPFVYATPPVTSIALPLVATGSQQTAVEDMLEPLIDASVNWLRLGLPVTTIKLVEIDPMKAAELKGAFAILKKRYRLPPPPAPSADGFSHDYFISYSHQNTREVRALYDEMLRLRPEARIFLDRVALDAGTAWQPALYEALDDCRQVVALFSPWYVDSKVCREEFNIALARHRDSGGGVLIPIYLYSAPLPTYMQMLQHIDCREGSIDKLRQAAARIVGRD